ncbi:acetylornithine deacetylase [Methylobacterium aerolatum]|uniref:Acetylornithine deacetylase n=1 Tax=Methylobacterium aerolatum TaxID=418708 RepID=A0ABU0I534_9HYPH|nr:acetylornithine deacetylase [Methylobacterium aerolatum]MDQ0448739.1 acetylornithine deacetylase [Methylobacterium aerolatum]GJD34937.1 Acetylornithine deacetylase [Methylobacterium aerolatum]
MDTLALLDRLIAFQTVSRDPNRPLIDFVRSLLAEHGIACELVESEGGKANLFCTIGPADRPGILLSGHTDVVPVDGQDWTSDPFRLRVADGRAYGRGAADMKGFVACALALALRAAGRDLAVPLHLALSHDEEIGCVGVRSLIDRLAGRGFRPRLTLVGEPTGLRIATGHKGKLAARATCHGVAGHSAMAPEALNAIHLACDLVGVLRARQEDLAEGGARDPDDAVPYSTIHVGVIQGGTALNIVPDRCTLDFEIRAIAADDPEAILAEIVAQAQAIAAACHPEFPEARFVIERRNAYPGLATPRDSEAVAFLGALVGSTDTHKVAFGTEGGLFADRLGTPTLICGPGFMDQGHKPDEFVTLAQLAACDALMDRLLDRLAA